MAELPDEELLVRLHAGEGRALDELYRRYGPLLLRYFKRMLWQDKKRAEDALHDVFLKLIENPLRADADRRFSTWLYSVAHNYCKNAYRQHVTRSSAIHPTLHRDRAILPAAANLVDRQAFSAALETLLAEEGEETRTIVVLRYELELPYADIAVIVGHPEGTVKSRLFNLRQRLAAGLEPYKSILES